MQDQAVVELSLRLPRPVAAEVEELKHQRPDLLARVLEYGLTRQLVLEHLERLQAREVGEALSLAGEA